MTKMLPAESAVALPRAYAVRVLAFMAQKLSGNIKINIRNGEILGVRIEEVVSNSLDKTG